MRLRLPLAALGAALPGAPALLQHVRDDEDRGAAVSHISSGHATRGPDDGTNVLRAFGTESQVPHESVYWGGWDTFDDEPIPSATIRMKKTPRTRVHASATPADRRRHVGAIIGCIGGYLVFTLLVVKLYWASGIKVILYVLAYIISLATLTISIKSIYDDFDFKFPKIITAFHMLFSAALGFQILYVRARTSGAQIIVPTPREFLSRIAPISCCFGVAVGLSNIGLLYVSPLIAEIMGSLGPLFSVGLTLLMGMPFHWILIVPILIVVGGAIVAIQPWSVTVTAWGLVCFLIASVVRSVKCVLQQEVMTGALSERFDEFGLLTWSCITSAVLMFVWSFISERDEPYKAFAQHQHKGSLAISLLVSIFLAVLLNTTHLCVTKALGAISSQLMAQTKAVLILLGSMAFLGDRCTTSELIGFAMVLVGTFLYSVLQVSFLPSPKPSEESNRLKMKPSPA